MGLYDFTLFYTASQHVLAGITPYNIPDFYAPFPLAVLFAPLAVLPE